MRLARAHHMQAMQQASNIRLSPALRRAAHFVVVTLALAAMFFASCMMVSAHDVYTAAQQADAGRSVSRPGPTAPESLSF